MSSFCVFVAYFLVCYFINSNCAQCPDVPITFGETEVYTCANYANCDDRVINGCLDGVDNVVHVKLKSNVQKLRRGAIRNMRNMKSLDLRKINLEVIEPDAFSNVPSIDSISAHDNVVAEIQNDVFTKLNFRTVDLTSNRITKIDDFAFAFMPRLYDVYLSNNLIDQIRSNWFLNSTRIGEIHLANNQLTVIDTDAFSKIKKLDYLNLSFNKLHQIGDFRMELKQLDTLNLAGNQLNDITFLKNCRILYLYISLNNVSYVDSSTSSTMEVKYMFPHPNPWQCVCLKRFWNETRALEESPDNDVNVKIWSENYPVCVEKIEERDKCTMIKDEEFKSCQEEYFKSVDYSKIENRQRTPISLLKLYDRYDNVIPIERH